ncbi:MAG: DNA polymerase I, partial [Chloroflexi bacterium]|nr:DNA polymerase I [Chloroflexota bacterium]
MHKKRLLLIDGHALAYRAYHALPPMNGPSGEPTNAVLGFANMLLKAIDDYDPQYVAATFDVGATFRHAEFEAYKATRAETPDDLRAQFGRVNQLVQALSIPIYTQEGYEADDVIGSLARQAEAAGIETIIVTGDSDTFQLATDKTHILTPKRTLGEVAVYDPDAVRERYGLSPAQLVDLKALAGDSSDNIPGVRGVGEKTATVLLQKYGSLQSIYDHIDEVTPERYRRALIQGQDSALLSQRLARIVTDLPVQLDLPACEWGNYDRTAVTELLRELGFRSLAQRLGESTGPTQQLNLFGSSAGAKPDAPAQLADCTYLTVDTTTALDDLVRVLHASKRVALDTETTSTDAMRTHLVGISLSVEPHKAYYVPVGHDERLHPGPQLPLGQVRAALAPLFADDRLGKICHNAQFDLVVLAQHGMPIQGLQCDTMIAAWLLDPSGTGLGLKALAWQRLGVQATEIESLIGSGRNQVTMDTLSVERVAPYACA